MINFPYPKIREKRNAKEPNKIEKKQQNKNNDKARKKEEKKQEIVYIHTHIQTNRRGKLIMLKKELRIK